MGAAGDMLTGALLELTEDPKQSLKELNSLGIPGIGYEMEKTSKCGIEGTKVHVLVNGEEEGISHHHHDHDHDHEHHHSGLHEIGHIVEDHLNLDKKIKEQIMSVYGLIADAESQVHGKPVGQVHFHEVGSMDAIADVAAVCYLIDKLKADRIVASPVHVGRGTVRCAHGILPVPAPATALILKDIPIYSRELIEGELCTPTGAALLRTFVSEFVQMPAMSIKKIGYGMGNKDFPIANCVRIFMGETAGNETDRIYELSFNVDDMTGEEIGHATKILLDHQARDVFTIPVFMKKNRPGTMICVICSEDQKEELVKLIFKHTSTLGIRQTIHERYILNRSIDTVDTQYGKIRIKKAEGYGITKEKAEYDDLTRLADENDMSIDEIRKSLKK
jgi:hypothetical protein